LAHTVPVGQLPGITNGQPPAHKDLQTGGRSAITRGQKNSKNIPAALTLPNEMAEGQTSNNLESCEVIGFAGLSGL